MISANYIHVDEPQFIDSDKGSTLINFGASSNPVLTLTGIESPKVTDMQFEYKQYGNDIVSRFTIPFPLAYKTIKLTHLDRAKDALTFFINKVKKQGLHSTEVMTHFMMKSDILIGRFLTEDYMTRNNMLETDIYDVKGHDVSYRVAGVDLASSQDYCAMVVTDVYENRNGNEYEYEVRNVFTFNPDKERIAQKDTSIKIAQICKALEIDMVMVDSSAQQQGYLSDIYSQIKKVGITTSVINYNFAGNNKLQLMSYVESCLISQQAKLPKKHYIKEHKSYAILFKELITLRKEKDNTKSQNLQYTAPKGGSDDHTFAMSLSIYVIKHVKYLISKNKMIEFENQRFYPKLNKFKLLSEIPQIEMFDTYIDVPF